MRDAKLFIFITVFLLSLTMEKIPYINIFFRDRVWVLYIAEIVFFILLFFPYHKLSAYSIILFLSLLNILFLITSMIFSFLGITVVPEILGILIYFSFWFIIVRQINIFIKSEKK